MKIGTITYLAKRINTVSNKKYDVLNDFIVAGCLEIEKKSTFECLPKKIFLN